MPIIAALTLADGAATPVNHTFGPSTQKDGIQRYYDRVTGIAVGFPAVTLSLREPTQKNSAQRNYRYTAKVSVPTLEQSSPSTSSGFQPAPTKAYECIANVEFVIPERSTDAERKNLLAYVKNLLANAVVTAGVITLEPVYGG